MSIGECILAIDLGTTSTKIAVVDISNRQVIHQSSRAIAHNELPSERSEFDVQRIVNNLHVLVSSIPTHAQNHIGHIVISGQMHGVVLWKCDRDLQIDDQNENINNDAEHCPWKKTFQGRFEVNGQVSPFYTWMDQRCSQEFLDALPKPVNGRISSGFGCATLFWLSQNQPEYLQEFNCAGNIVDFVTSMLTHRIRPAMSHQLAHSWGYFSRETNSWELEKLQAATFPIHLLPVLAAPGTPVGHLTDKWMHIPGNAIVYVGLGDLQCSVYPFLTGPNNAAMNVSTSAQLVFHCPSSDHWLQGTGDCFHCGDKFPYFESNQNIMVMASLNGGNVLSRFVKMLKSWMHELNSPGVQEDQMWSRLDELASTCTSDVTGDLSIVPTLFGERHSPDGRASVSGLRAQNLSLGSVYAALCRGIIRNLADMANLEHLRALGVDTVSCAGSCLRRNVTVTNAVKEIFHNFQLEFAEDESACLGAANYLCDSLSKPMSEQK